MSELSPSRPGVIPVRRALALVAAGVLAVAPLAAQAPPAAGTPAAGTPAAGTPAAEPPAAPPAAAPAAEEPKFELTLSGFYAFDGYSQNNFFLGRDPAGAISDHDAYGVQILRLQPEVSYGKNLKAVMRIDLAQGIWGLDDSTRDSFRPGFTNATNNKDTNFEVHVDWAYVEARIPRLGDTLLRVGRMKNKLGNLLVLDVNGDGVQVGKEIAGWSVLVDWTKVFEGTDGLTDERFPGGPDGRDATLVFLDVAGKLDCGFSLNPYLAHYRDDGTADARAYVPDDLQHNLPRFYPQVTEATALGLAFSGKAGKVELKGEASWLTGKDEIANTSSGAAQRWDVNNGDLEGWNLYLDARLPAGPGKLGAVFGMGSGDDDPMAGKGNLNKIVTNGFFYLSEIWEDSVMPDEEGITPQGLGSPAHRGYRELQNTTVVQLNYGWAPAPDWNVFVAAQWLRATEALSPWADLDGDGTIEPGEFGSASSSDLGFEVDAKIDWKLMKNLTWTLRGGVFFPGDAAGYLINGTNRYDDKAWELRTTLHFGFQGLKLTS